MSSSPEAGLPPLAPPSSNSGLLEVFRRRYLLRLLVRSTVDARYQGTFLGWFWSYLQPFVRFCMFYFIFQVMIGRGGVPGSPRYVENFAIHLFSGMVLVHFFTETFNGGTRSLVSNRSLIVKLSMPRELFPVAHMLVALWHTGPMLVILTGACLFLGWTPDPVGIAAGLLGFLLIAFLGLALALIFSVANVFFRDFGKVVQTLTQFVTFSVPFTVRTASLRRTTLALAWTFTVVPSWMVNAPGKTYRWLAEVCVPSGARFRVVPVALPVFRFTSWNRRLFVRKLTAWAGTARA